MQRNQRGMTLIEVLVVTAIMAMISGSILMMFTSASDTYRKTVMRGVAQQEAAKATERLRDVLRLSVEVDGNKKDEIEFYLMPWNDVTNTALIEPQVDEFGSRVHVYRGNDNAQKRADGQYLWLESRGPGSNQWNDPVKLTNHIEDIDLTYYYVEYDDVASEYIHIEIPEQGANRHERRRINAVRLTVTTVASGATDPGLAKPNSRSTATTTTVVLLPNAAFMPGAADLLDSKNPNIAAQPREYLAGRGRIEVAGFIPLVDP